MLRPASIAVAIAVPVTTAVIAAAILVEVLGVMGRDVSALHLDVRAFETEPWRLWTSALVHANAVHLLFNLLWMWSFGARIEWRYGSWRTLALYLFLAGVSGAAEHAIFEGGVGLSGVVYGLFGLLWVVSKRDPKLSDAMDRGTAQLFVIWFFVCIAMTITDVLPVANVAHGMGAAAGAGVGWAITRRAQRSIVLGLVVAAGIGVLAAAAFARPWINLSEYGGFDEARLGDAALDAGDLAEAERRYRASLAVSEDARVWHNLGVVYDRLDRDVDVPDRQYGDEAFECFDRAFELDPEGIGRRAAAAVYAREAGGQAMNRGDRASAIRYFERALELEPDDEPTRLRLEAARALPR